MKLLKRIGLTSEIWQIFVQDNSLATGAGLTSLSPTTTSVLCYYKRNNGTAAVQVTLADMTLGAYTSGGLKAVANMPGFYDFCPPDAALATGAASVSFLLYPATSTVAMAPVPIEVQLIQADLEDATDLGLTNLDAAITSRLASASYTAADNAGITAIKAKTDQMTFSSGDILATLAGEPVAVGSYATTTASPLMPTVAGRTLNVLATGEAEADLQRIDGEDVATNTATLKLKTLDIRNSTGDAIHAESTGGDGYGGYFKGFGASAGIFGGGGLTGHGFEGQGGNNGGAGALFQGTQDAGFKAFGGTGFPGMDVGDINGDLLGDVNNVLFNVQGEVASIGSQGIDSIWDEPFEGTTTVRQALRGVFAALLNKSSGHGSGASTPRYRDIADTKNRIDAVTDANGNRTTVTLDLT